MNCDKKDLLLYAVTDRHWLDGRRLVDVVRESLDGGVTMVQLREKTLDEANFFAEAKELQALCRERGVPFLVNDNVEIAREMDADGVHVGQREGQKQLLCIARVMLTKPPMLILDIYPPSFSLLQMVRRCRAADRKKHRRAAGSCVFCAQLVKRSF